MIDFSSLFKAYTEEACRLETLPEYNVPGEWEIFQHFQNTGILLPIPGFQEHLDAVRAKTDTKSKYTRIRIVDVPLTPYQIFEIKIGYLPLLEAGADIYILERGQYDQIVKSLEKPVNDFWIFDNSSVLNMLYDGNGKKIASPVISSKAEISGYVQIKEKILEQSVPLMQFMGSVSLI